MQNMVISVPSEPEKPTIQIVQAKEKLDNGFEDNMWKLFTLLKGHRVPLKGNTLKDAKSVEAEITIKINDLVIFSSTEETKQ